MPKSSSKSRELMREDSKITGRPLPGSVPPPTKYTIPVFETIAGTQVQHLLEAMGEAERGTEMKFEVRFPVVRGKVALE